MNQDQVKENLLLLNSEVEDFTLIFSGKKSKKANGVYHPEKKEIILHNKNFNTENEMMYTAIHEFAHHVQFTEAKLPVSSMAHTTHFWNIFHKFLDLAEEKEIYKNVFEEDGEFSKLTKKIKQNFVFTNGVLMKDFGKLLIEAMELCRKKNASFEDYISRELLLNRSTVKNIMKISTMEVDPKVGYENMKILANVKDDDERKEIETEMLNGKTPDQVKSDIKEKSNQGKSAVEFLQKERTRLERTIKNLSKKLEDIEKRLQDVGPEDGDAPSGDSEA